MPLDIQKMQKSIGQERDPKTSKFRQAGSAIASRRSTLNLCRANFDFEFEFAPTATDRK
jgi:hypothetical protein